LDNIFGINGPFAVTKKGRLIPTEINFSILYYVVNKILSAVIVFFFKAKFFAKKEKKNGF